MTPSLRKAHRYTWFLLAVLLPLGWLAAIWATPEQVWQTPVRTGMPEQLPVLLQSRETGDFVVNLRQDTAARHRQIEVFITKPLTDPNMAIVFRPEDEVRDQKESLLGLLGSRGVWRFELDSLQSVQQKFTLQLEDKIQDRTLRNIRFEL